MTNDLIMIAKAKEDLANVRKSLVGNRKDFAKHDGELGSIKSEVAQHDKQQANINDKFAKLKSAVEAPAKLVAKVQAFISKGAIQNEK